MDGPRELEAKVLASRDEALKGLSERTRTLCLGGLALVWGVLVQKKDQALDATPFWKRVLLGVGLSLLIVLVLDFLEYMFAFQLRRKIAGESIWGGLDYDAWEKRMRFMKLTLGAVSLIALCLVLSSILAPPLFGDSHTYPFYGNWCGGYRSQGQYTELTVRDSASAGLLVALAFEGDDEWVQCADVRADEQARLHAFCGQASIKVSPGDNGSDVKIDVRFGNTHSTRVLGACR